MLELWGELPQITAVTCSGLEPNTPVVRFSTRVRQSHDLQVIVLLPIDQKEREVLERNATNETTGAANKFSNRRVV